MTVATMLREALKVVWTPELRALYSRFPSVLRSKRWDEIQALVISGDSEKARAIAQNLEDKSPSARIENVMARRLRLQRVALFTRQARAEKELRDFYDKLGTRLAIKVSKKATGSAVTPSLLRDVDDAVKELKAFTNKWLSSILRDSTRMALKNVGDALQPIFKDNKEIAEEILSELNVLEGKLSFILKNVDRKTAKVPLFTKKWRGIQKRIVKTILKSNALGISAKQRIVELAQRTSNEMKKILANNIAQGVAPATIARKIKKFLSPQITKAIERGETLPRGIYRSVFKNTMRLARTESNKAYSTASAEWAKDKTFIQGIKVTLSPSHAETDVCDSLAGLGTMTPDEFQLAIPAHPHCMCYPTYVIKDEFLDKENS